MPRTTVKLPRAITLRSYDEVNAWLTNFVGGVFNLLFLIGRPGLSKSQMALSAIGERPHAWVECHATKLALHCKLYAHRKQAARAFAEEELSLSGKWAFVKAKLPWTDADGHKRFLRETFERLVFSSEDLKELIESAVRGYASELEGIEVVLVLGTLAVLRSWRKGWRWHRGQTAGFERK